MVVEISPPFDLVTLPDMIMEELTAVRAQGHIILSTYLPVSEVMTGLDTFTIMVRMFKTDTAMTRFFVKVPTKVPKDVSTSTIINASVEVERAKPEAKSKLSANPPSDDGDDDNDGDYGDFNDDDNDTADDIARDLKISAASGA